MGKLKPRVDDKQTCLAQAPCGGETARADVPPDADQQRRLLRELQDRVAQLEAELARAQQTAAVALQSKNEFLGNLSHEIRTPMTAIVGFSEMLDAEQLSPPQREDLVRQVRENAQLLLRLIDDVLELSQIETGSLPLVAQECPPLRLVREVADVVKLDAREKNVALEIDVVEPLPAAVHTDPTRLKQLLLTLLSSAVAASDGGEVTVTVSAVGVGDAGRQLQFAVHDQGPPIAASDLERVFLPCSDVEPSTARRGLGGVALAIARRLAQRLGGDLRVVSDPQQGTTFTLLLDIRPLEAPLPAARPTITKEHPLAERLRGRVLVAEDGAANQHLLRSMLVKAGLEVDLAVDGRQTLQCVVQAAAEDRPYDILVMDIQMPGINGFEAVGRLRTFGWDGPIIAVTALAMADDRRRCLESGCDDYFPKPVDRPALMARIKQYLESPPIVSPAAFDLEHGGTGHLGLLDDPRFDFSKRMGAFHTFVDGLPQRLEALQPAAAAADSAGLARQAHRLMVAARLFGLTEIARAADAVARTAANPAEISAAQCAVAELASLCDRLLAGHG